MTVNENKLLICTECQNADMQVQVLLVPNVGNIIRVFCRHHRERSILSVLIGFDAFVQEGEELKEVYDPTKAPDLDKFTE